jgi:outer membrane protein OmpA-like peptidoglycan-associated protein
MDFSVIKKLASEQKYASQKVDYGFKFAPASASSIQAESDEILTKTVVIHFFPNSWDLGKTVVKNVDGVEKENLYDPNAKFVIEEVGKLAGQYGAARIVIKGHTDSSMRGPVESTWSRRWPRTAPMRSKSPS